MYSIIEIDTSIIKFEEEVANRRNQEVKILVFVSGLLVATGIFCIVGAFIYHHRGHDIGPSYIIGAALALMGIVSIVLNYIFDEKMLLRFWAIIFAIIFLSVPVKSIRGIIRHKEKWDKALTTLLLLGIFCLVGVFVI